MDIVWNGDWFYANKSHAFVDSYIVAGLHMLGHNVRVTSIIDNKHFDKNNDRHKLIKSLSEKRFESDNNIFKMPQIALSKKDKKYNCVVFGDGSYTFTIRERDLIYNSAVTNLWLPTIEQANIVDKLLNISVNSPGVDGGFDPKLFHPEVSPFDYGVPKDTFKFILACDGAQRTPGRPFGGFRGSDIAIEAFMREFSKNDAVCLVVKVARNYDIVDKFIEKFRGSDSPQIIKDYKLEHYSAMPSKWKAANCMLNPIRDCRWEMCCLEALAVGTPCIATRCGGPKRYGKSGVFFVEPIVTDGDLTASRGDVALSRDFWTEPTVGGFREKMREAYENTAKLKDFGMEGAINVHKVWKWVDMSQRVVDFFEGKEPKV